MDLVVAITLGSCMQIALFLTPFLVVLGWVLDVPMSLSNLRLICPLTCHRFREFSSRGDFHFGYLYGIFDYGWQFKLDGGCNVVGCLWHCRHQLLALSG